ncbi:MAG: nucleotidyltransferase domain-containing protein [Gemmatimonadota bacterium]
MTTAAPTRVQPPPAVRRPPGLDSREHDAVGRLVERARRDFAATLLCAALFGSKARGDDDDESDVDVLLLYDSPRRSVPGIAERILETADAIRERTGVALEPWTVATPDLRVGCRTPMLVDALHDAAALWPPDRPPPRIGFTPADACFCAERLLEWIACGGPATRRALEHGRAVDAAGRARDDMTRLATAALLLTGCTRHRRAGSLLRFQRRFVGRIVSPAVRPAVRWALLAFPPDGGRGYETAPVSPAAVATADLGLGLAARMESLVLPWVLARIDALRRSPPVRSAAARSTPRGRSTTDRPHERRPRSYPHRRLSSVGSVSVGGESPPESTSNMPI